jgi:hypothetical protein
MKTSYLFPHRFKTVSGVVFFIVLLFMLYSLFDNSLFNSVIINQNVFAFSDSEFLGKTTHFGWIEDNIFDEIIALIFIASGLIFAFSKEKIEDEMTAKIRLDSLAWATYANYIVFALCILFIYGLDFLSVLILAGFTHLVFFILRFNLEIYKVKRANNEE